MFYKKDCLLDEPHKKDTILKFYNIIKNTIDKRKIKAENDI